MLQLVHQVPHLEIFHRISTMHPTKVLVLLVIVLEGMELNTWGYQQQFKSTNPLYTSNFNPHQPWQAGSSSSVPYAYQPSEFTTAFFDFSITGVVPNGGTAMGFQYNSTGFLPSMEMVRTDHNSEYNPPHLLFQQQQQQAFVNRVINDSVLVNFLTDEAIPSAADNSNHRSEYSITLLPFQQQHFCFDAIVESSLPSDFFMDGGILMGCNSSTSIHADERLSNLIDVTIPEATPRKEMLEKFEPAKEEQHPLMSNRCLMKCQ
uniref:Uncharacterized protein n=1 Tax=Nicotiana tabacum TaxID=4097 RepID=A0A1S3ZBM6_TOBAC|nr:PREDICTED: uncharacterized protein LOC107785099 [Nicotiana tabacum]